MQILNHGPRMEDDLAVEHEKMIYGIVYHAVREITGQDPGSPEMIKAMETNLALLTYDDRSYMDYTWHGEPIVRVHRLTFKMVGKDTQIRHRKVEQLWKKRHLFIH